MDNVKKRYENIIKNPPTRKVYTSRSGYQTTVITHAPEIKTLGELDAEYDADLEAMGYDVAKMKRDGINFDNVDPDSPIMDKYRKGGSRFLSW